MKNTRSRMVSAMQQIEMTWNVRTQGYKAFARFCVRSAL